MRYSYLRGASSPTMYPLDVEKANSVIWESELLMAFIGIE